MPTYRPTLFMLALVLALSLHSLAYGASTDWKDAQGVAFRGEPAEVFGPFALFRTPSHGSRRVLLGALSAEDQVRFANSLAATRVAPSATPEWGNGPVADDLAAGVCVLKNGKLLPAQLQSRQAPEVLVVLYAAGNNGESWFMYHNFVPTYHRLRAVYGDRFEALLFGLRTDANQHREFATATGMPWLITDYTAQSAMPTLSSYAPAEGIRAVALSRNGLPLASSPVNTLYEVRRFVDEVTDLLYLLDPNNSRCWPDRLKYLNTVRPALHATDSVPPLLLGSPFRDDILRRKGVTDVAARIEVGADGRATAVDLALDCGVPEPLRATITDGLRRGAVFSPAIVSGKPVAGSYEFRHIVPPAPPCSPADLAWVNGEAHSAVPLTDWLVLRPISVPEQSFSSVERVDENGVNVLTPFEVSDEKIAPTQQRDSFNSDWFEADGADSVRPTAGAEQTVDGHTLTWQALVADAGFVDMRSTSDNCDFSIGYAWTELDVAKETDAWLGIGSDDGLKIWLNGQLVHNRWIRRNSKLDEEIVPLRLRTGKNHLLIKIQNRTIDWSFVARLRTR